MTARPFLASFFRWLPLLIPGLLGGALLWVLLPPLVVAVDDDFWYLRSVVKTIWHGRPWTDEWLAPWSAGTTSLSALLYLATGSFRFAINGSLVLTAGLAWTGFAWLHRARGFGMWVIVVAGWLLFLFPTLLFMEMMFTSVALYWTALWWCLACAIRGKWTAFFVVWAVAASTRQSAVTWMAIPAWQCFAALLRGRFRPPFAKETIGLAAGVVAGALWVIFLKLFMNPTVSQDLVLGHLHFDAGEALALGMALCALAAGVGLGRFATLWRDDLIPALSAKRLAAGLAGALAGLAAALWFRDVITTTHGCLDTPGGGTVFGLLGALAGGSLAFSPPRSAPGFGWAALGTLALVTHYRGEFDYYYAEIAILAYGAVLAAYRPATEGGRPDRVPSSAPHRYCRIAVALCLAFVGLWNAACALRLKVAFEGIGNSTRLYEKALRNGSLAPDQIGFAALGYVGWRLHDYHIARNEIRSIAGFMHYADPWDGTRGTSVITRFSPLVKRWPDWFPTRNAVALREHPEGKDLASLKSRVLWSQPVTYTLRRVEGGGRDPKLPRVDLALYQAAPFPLTDGEWRELIESGSIVKKE